MGAFTDHIVDAIKINYKRMPMYAKASKGKSFPVSIALILFEIGIIPLAKYYDWYSASWKNKYNIPVMDEDFISMTKTPEFAASAHIPVQKTFPVFPLSKMIGRTLKLMNEDKWMRAHEDIKKLRKQIDTEARGSHFLVRHFLESIHRSMLLTVYWDQKLPANKKLRRRFRAHRCRFIKWQTVGLGFSQSIDKMAFKIHQKGIPILLNDVPKIPVPEIKS